MRSPPPAMLLQRVPIGRVGKPVTIPPDSVR